MYTLMHTTPVWHKHLHMHGAQNTCLNAYHTPRKKCICTRACAPMQQCRYVSAIEAIANLSWVLREHRAGCRCSLLSRPNQLPVAVRSRNPSKSMLALGAVAAALPHKHHQRKAKSKCSYFHHTSSHKLVCEVRHTHFETKTYTHTLSHTPSHTHSDTCIFC